MTDIQPSAATPDPIPPAGGSPAPDAGAAVTQPVTWTPAASIPEADGPAPQPAAPAPAPQPVPQPTLAPAPRRRGAGPALLITALLATAALSSGGTYLAVSAAKDTAAAPPASNAAFPGSAATPPAGQAAPATPAPTTPPAGQAAPATPAPATGERSIVDIVKAVGPAVVTIVAEGATQESSILGQGGQGTATGSGVIFDASGLVLTNRHVVSGNPAKITVNLKDGRSLDGSIYGIDTLTDLAIVKVESTDLPSAPIGNSSTIEVGQEAIAIGSPLGEFTDSVTSGIVSALGRSIQVQDGTLLSNLIQTDTAINPGNSGGPLLDRSGNVIGINTAVAGGAQGIGFAIPINIARPLLAQASSGQELARAWFGIRFQTIDPELKASANLPVDNGAWIPTQIGTTDGGTQVPAPSQDPNQGLDPNQVPDELKDLFDQFGINPFGNGQDPFGQGQGQDAQPAAPQGPSIVAGSPAEAAGLAEGDIITAIDGVALTATTPLDLVVGQLAPGQTVTLDVLRDGRALTISITLGTRPATL
ncbi:MAG: trypsin-like peptidase domain-containing protein [Chloroflexi bacterium]|jgi:S1-C subfamily serine protease|nr:trypsin-like peptidase domain-containing protein [Chloroflexota bacterium]